MVSIEEAAEMLEIDFDELIELLKENDYLDAEGQPLEEALSSGFMKPGGKIGRRGMTQLFSIIASRGI